MEGIVLKEESYQIVGACFEVHNELGPGFLEAVYHECLAREFTDRQVPFQSQPEVAIRYKGRTLRKYYQPDFLCYDKVLIELKAVRELNDLHRAQLINYLRATQLPLGLLVNFGSPRQLEHERIANTHPSR